jgi:formate hydrogenlyase subunit 4
MIHEVMILDHSGPDLALFLFGSALRFALFSALLVDLAQPGARLAWPAGIAALCLGVVAVAALVGILESSMARLRLIRVPQYLASALVLAALGALVTLR